MAGKNKANELHLERVYDAPVKAVWDAWTDEKQVAKWWGPRGFTITTHKKDLRPGGHWDYTMHGPDGTDYPNKTVYHEVEVGKRLVYDHGGNDERAPMFRVTVTFAEVRGQTKMDMTMTMASAEAMEEARKVIKQANGNSTWDRLAEYLAKEESGEEKFVINRSFDVPVEKMYEVWTDPKHVAQWLPPTGFRMEFIEVDMKPGGHAFYFMSGEGGIKMYGKIHYLTFERPHRLVYTQQFADEKGATARHPMDPNWPATMKTTVQFTEEGPASTRVTVTWQPEGQVSPAELATFVKMKAGMTQGWTGSFDKLEGYFAK